MKIQERLRKLDQPQGSWPVLPDGTPVARLAADLLDKCEAAFHFIAQSGCDCDECNKAREMLTALEGKE